MADQQVESPTPKPPRPPARGLTGVTTGFFTGVSFLLRGLGMYARSPRRMFLGLVPAFIASIVLVGAFVALVYPEAMSESDR